jgi:hypothetical protein
MADPVRFSDIVAVRCPPQLSALVERAARARGMKPAEWVRQALKMGVRLDGFDPTHHTSPNENASVEGADVDTESGN